jgi:hypothetical protein
VSRYSVTRNPVSRHLLTGLPGVALLVCLALSAVAITLMLLPNAEFALLYGNLLYPALTSLFTRLTSWTFLPLGMAILPLLTGIFLWRALAPHRRMTLAVRLARALLLALSLLASYLIIWGVNYRRPPLLELLDVVEQPVAETELIALAQDLLLLVGSTSEELPAVTSSHRYEALEAVSAELEHLAWRLGWPASLPARVKLLPPGTLLRSGYAGMLFPFTLEPQVDGALTETSQVAIGAHELAHAAGFASEVDADLAALLAGLQAQNTFARYATALSLLSRTLASLPPPERFAIVDSLPERAARDLAEVHERSARYLQPSLARRITAIYNRLLKGQGVDAGVASYGRAPHFAALLRRHDLLPLVPGDRKGG